jgi:hypothetical protein
MPPAHITKSRPEIRSSASGAALLVSAASVADRITERWSRSTRFRLQYFNTRARTPTDRQVKIQRQCSGGDVKPVESFRFEHWLGPLAPGIYPQWRCVGGNHGKPIAVAALKAFNPERYKTLFWANPVSLNDPRNCAQVPMDSDRTTENGFVWDIYTQTGLFCGPHKNRPRDPVRIRNPVRRVVGSGRLRNFSVFSRQVSGRNADSVPGEYRPHAVPPSARCLDSPTRLLQCPLVRIRVRACQGAFYHLLCFLSLQTRRTIISSLSGGSGSG